jgi:chromosome segregation ATPase
VGDFIQIFNDLKGVLGGVGAIAVAAGIYFWRERGQRQLEGANTGANISAIDHWRAVAERSDAALVAMTERADKFAEERNEAIRALSRLEGQIAQMTLQLEAQSRELQALREQVADLQEQTHAKP